MNATARPLVGRGAELALIRSLVQSARASAGRAALFRGEAGSGKSSLLAAAFAHEEDVLRLHCVGMEWETEVPYSALQALLAPLLSDLDPLPEPQRLALEVALGVRAAADLPTLHLSTAVLSLLLEQSRDRPVVVVIDDLHWVDEPTRRVLAHVASRIDGERVLLIGATRVDIAPPWPGAALHDLPPLAHDDVGRLAAHELGRSLPASALSDLVRESNGNPLVVVEAVRRFGDRLERRGSGFEAPLPITDVAERIFAERLDAISAQCRAALDLLSVSFTDDLALVEVALRARGIAMDAVEEAERAGLLVVFEGTIAFSHPLLRSLIHASASRTRHRESHAAFATVQALGPDLRAWHGAGAADGPDDEIAGALADAAERFAARGGLVGAAQALFRASQLTADPDLRARRLLLAADAAHGSGRSAWGSSLVDEAERAATDPALLVRCAYSRLSITQHFEPSARSCAESYLDLADRARGLDPDLEAELCSSAAVDAAIGREQDSVARACRRLESLDLNDLSDFFREEALCALGLGLLCFGGDAERRARELLTASARRRLTFELPREGYLVEALIWCDDLDGAAALGERALRRATATADAFTVVSAIGALGLLRYRTGEWSVAQELFDRLNALGDADHEGQTASARMLCGPLAAARGDDEMLERALTDAATALAFGYADAAVYEAQTRGLRELGAGRYGPAAQALRAARDATSDPDRPDLNPLSWSLDLVEALVLAGDLSGARAARDDLERRASRTARQWLHAALLLADGLLSEGAEAEAPLGAAIAAFDEARAPFERARAQLWLGRKLVGDGRRPDAAAPLRSALSEFERLSADPWVEQARRALGLRVAEASGGRHRGDVAAYGLTAQERQVAALVARGATNKQAAGELFLSPKTVEAHLSRIYRKLGVTSRTQLAARWGEVAQR